MKRWGGGYSLFWDVMRLRVVVTDVSELTLEDEIDKFS
jgi:hypothetical protein